MITFYPRDIAMWRREFTFAHDITLTTKQPTTHRTFYDESELFDFLKAHGVRMDDVHNPLQFIKHGGTGHHHSLGDGVFDVVQWTLIGWVKNDFM